VKDTITDHEDELQGEEREVKGGTSKERCILYAKVIKDPKKLVGILKLFLPHR